MPAPAAESSITKFRRLARYIARVADDPSMARRPNTMRKGGAKKAARKAAKTVVGKIVKSAAKKISRAIVSKPKRQTPALIPAARAQMNDTRLPSLAVRNKSGSRKRAFDA